MWEKVVDVINGGQKFVITTHQSPEGDALGSEIALKHFLDGLGKETVMLNNDSFPSLYRHFDPDHEVIYIKESDRKYDLQDYDAIFMVDVAAWSQLGDFAETIQSSPITNVCIDHHISNSGFAEINVIDANASSAGEMIFDLVNHMNGKITKEIAEAVFLAISTDTGWFKFSNTSAKTLKACSKLFENGVKPEMMFETIYQNKSWSYLKLMSLALENLHSECNGRLAWTKITHEMIKASGSEFADTDALIDLIRSVNDVEVVILFKESKENKTKISLRSKHTLNVSKLASRFGGGGHVRAAGASFKEPIDQVIEKVLSVTTELIEKDL